jgi:hypothetical protein
MRAHGLGAWGLPTGNTAHDGHIITDCPDVMWGTDGTRFYTIQDGWYWFWEVVDHHTDEVMGWHVATYGDRWAPWSRFAKASRLAYGTASKEIVRGLQIRCDWSPHSVVTAWRFRR